MAVAPHQGRSLPDMFGPGAGKRPVQKPHYPASLASPEKFKQSQAEPGEMGRPAAESPSRFKSIITVSNCLKSGATVRFDRFHPNISNPCRDDERGIDAVGFPAHNLTCGMKYWPEL